MIDDIEIVYRVHRKPEVVFLATKIEREALTQSHYMMENLVLITRAKF